MISGDTAEVHVQQMTSIALILHEWGTNSTKYGALSVADGKIRIKITTTDDKVDVTWDETGGNGTATEGNGFGTSLVDATAAQLRAEVSAGPTDDGYMRRLVYPMIVT